MSLNEILLDTGFAAYYTCAQHPEWSQKELYAHTNKLGLYGDEFGGFTNRAFGEKIILVTRPIICR